MADNTRHELHLIARSTAIDYQRTAHPDIIIGKLQQFAKQLRGELKVVEEALASVIDWWEEEGADPPFEWIDTNIALMIREIEYDA